MWEVENRSTGMLGMKTVGGRYDTDLLLNDSKMNVVCKTIMYICFVLFFVFLFL